MNELKLFAPLICTLIAAALFTWLLVHHFRRTTYKQVETARYLYETPYSATASQFELDEEVFEQATLCEQHRNKSDCDTNQRTNEQDCRRQPEVPHARDKPCCPRCFSERIVQRDQGRKAGSTIGAVAGATSGVAATLSGAEVGATVGLIGGPIGSIFGGLAGAVIAGLVASAAGCAAGAAFGEVVDENVLGNRECLECGHRFVHTSN